MKPLLGELPKLYQEHDEFRRRLENYQRVIQTEEWQFVKDTFLTVKGTIYDQLLSARYTNLSAEEKDIEQKTYYNVIQVLDFLSNPMKWIKYKRTMMDYIKPKKKQP